MSDDEVTGFVDWRLREERAARRILGPLFVPLSAAAPVSITGETAEVVGEEEQADFTQAHFDQLVSRAGVPAAVLGGAATGLSVGTVNLSAALFGNAYPASGVPDAWLASAELQDALEAAPDAAPEPAVGGDEAAPGAESGTVGSLADRIFDLLDGPNMPPAVADAVNAFVRARMCEDGVLRWIMPPVAVTNDELDQAFPLEAYATIPVRTVTLSAWTIRDDTPELEWPLTAEMLQQFAAACRPPLELASDAEEAAVGGSRIGRTIGNTAALARVDFS